MFRTIIWFIYFWLYQIIALFFLLKIYFLKQFSSTNKANNYIHKVTQNWAKAMVSATGSKVTVKGLENIPKDKTVLFVSNHQGNFDIPLLMGYINKPKGFIAKIELAKMPIVNIWMKLIRCVFIDRKNLRQSIKAIQEGIAILKSGYSMVVFPEGTRSKGEPMKEFKKGSLRLAVKTKVPIVPIAISGSYKIMEERKFLITPAQVNITIGQPILLHEISEENSKNIVLLVQSTIKELLEVHS